MATVLMWGDFAGEKLIFLYLLINGGIGHEGQQ